MRNKSKFKIKENSQPSTLDTNWQLASITLHSDHRRAMGSKQEVSASEILKAPEANFYFLICQHPFFLMRTDLQFLENCSSLQAKHICGSSKNFLFEIFYPAAMLIKLEVGMWYKVMQIQILPWDVIKSPTEGRSSFFMMPRVTYKSDLLKYTRERK